MNDDHTPELEGMSKAMEVLAQMAATGYINQAFTEVHKVLLFPGLTEEQRTNLAEQAANLMANLLGAIVPEFVELTFESREIFVEKMSKCILEPEKMGVGVTIMEDGIKYTAGAPPIHRGE